jgi:hypothetical protein
VSFRERAVAAAIKAAGELRKEAGLIGIVRSVDASESARWLHDMADEMVTAADRPDLTREVLTAAGRVYRARPKGVPPPLPLPRPVPPPLPKRKKT